MSAYIPQFCIIHGEWDMDVDNPGNCPECLAALAAELKDKFPDR